MNSRRKAGRHGLAFWLAVESILVTATAVATFAALQLMNRFYWSDDSVFVVLSAAVTIGAIVATTAALFSRYFNRQVSTLTRGLRKVAEGDFSVRLEPKDGGPLAAAYADFNQMGEELQSVQTLRTDFINHFSHEFKTPISAIKGFAELLQEPGVTAEERDRYLQIIVDESERLTNLTNSALLMSKLETQTSIPDRTPFLLDEQLKSCAILLSGQWEHKRIEFSMDVEPVTYVGSEELMRHVWLNLLGNAVKYTPPGGEIAVSLRAGPEEIVVRVADTGSGMSEETQAHIFDKYYQGVPTRSGKGLGLGLSIAHRVVELCGGRIEVRSAENQGSVFTVRLPRPR